MRKPSLAVFALVLLGSGAFAQDQLKDPKRAEKLIELGFRYRREGELSAAGAALQEAISGLPEKSDERRRVALDAYDVAFVESKWERAARLVAGVDPVRQVRALLKGDKVEPALIEAQKSKDPLAEGLALRAMKKHDAALAAFAKAGAPGVIERAELLAAQDRFQEAAAEFEKAGDLYARARVLERAGSIVDWKPVLDDLKKKTDALLGKGSDAKRAIESAANMVAKERARHLLALNLDATSREYEKSAYAFEKANDRAKALKQLELAVQYSEQARGAMTDANRDHYGNARVKQLGLIAREEQLHTKLRSLKR